MEINEFIRQLQVLRQIGATEVKIDDANSWYPIEITGVALKHIKKDGTISDEMTEDSEKIILLEF